MRFESFSAPKPHTTCERISDGSCTRAYQQERHIWGIELEEMVPSNPPYQQYRIWGIELGDPAECLMASCQLSRDTTRINEAQTLLSGSRIFDRNNCLGDPC